MGIKIESKALKSKDSRVWYKKCLPKYFKKKHCTCTEHDGREIKF